MANKKITDLMSGTPVRDSLLESAIDISGTMDSRKVKAGVIADLASANVAALYDTTVTYAIGQYCLYEGDIYRCIAITTGAFDSTAWVQIVVTGEFRRVVELTSAQYTALSSAEKNNGTLYVLTDEETTAADIPYSAGVSVADKLDNVPTFDTLTTSDNNKLLGVSVSGSDISVGAVSGTSTTKSCEISLGTGSSLNCFMQTYGKVVVLNLVGYLTSSATIATSDNLFTGLPVINGGNEIFSISQKGRFRLYNGAGEAIIRLYDISATSNYVGNVFVYVTQ